MTLATSDENRVNTFNFAGGKNVAMVTSEANAIASWVRAVMG